MLESLLLKADSGTYITTVVLDPEGAMPFISMLAMRHYPQSSSCVSHLLLGLPSRHFSRGLLTEIL